MDESRKKFEEYVAKKLRLPFEMITEARNGDRYFAFSSMDIRHSLNEWWTLWQASRAAIELDIDWPESNDDFWKDGEEGAYAMGYEDGRDKTVIAVMKAIRAAGIKEKNF
ncbi:hypothetical protein, partial [Escherichia coli]